MTSFVQTSTSTTCPVSTWRRWNGLDERVDGEVFNAGYENHSVMQIAEMVRNVVGAHVEIERTPSDDNRSYQISSAKIERILGFRPQRTIEDAIRDLVAAFDAGMVPDSFDDPRWFNIKMMQTNPRRRQRRCRRNREEAA